MPQQLARRAPSPPEFRMRPVFTTLPLLALVLPAAAHAQSADTPGIVVIGEGLPLPPGTPAYGSVTIDRDRLTSDASGRLEDVLADVAGVQQFRRSDRRAANPTAQGVTPRALGDRKSTRLNSSH